MSTGELESTERQREELRTETYRIILDQMRIAADKNDMARFDSLVARLLPGEHDFAVAEAAQAIKREARMDKWRIRVAAALIAGLVAIIVYALGVGSDVGQQYVSLVSGLAGIAIGWLYGSSGQHGSNVPSPAAGRGVAAVGPDLTMRSGDVPSSGYSEPGP